MRAGFGCLALALLVLVGSVQGQEIRLMPAASTGDIICMPGDAPCGPTEIILAKGIDDGGVTVTMFLEMAGWDQDDDQVPLLGGYQGAFDATTHEGGLAAGVAYPTHPGNPGTPALCDVNWYDQSGLNVCTEQVFMALKICTSNIADPVANADWLSDCGADPSICGIFPAGCIDRPDFVYLNLGYTPTISCAGADYTMGCASTDCKDDEDLYYYGGTAFMEVPGCAKGTYNVGFVDNVNFTLFNDCGGVLIPGLTAIPAQITIETGSCCYAIGTVDAGCTDGLRADECEQLAPPRDFRPRVECTVDCCACLTDFDCDDDDACTTDWCDDCVCYHSPNYLEGIECCDPVTGGKIIIDDGNVCSDDVCMPDGSVTHHCNTDGCDDDNLCTENDTCTDLGTDECACVGTPIPDCSLKSELLIEVDPGGYPDANCFDVGNPVYMTVSLVFGTQWINGAQLNLVYDDECLELVDVGPCEGSVFTQTPAVSHWGDGHIFYVTHVEPYDLGEGFVEGTQEDDIVCLEFQKMAGCDECDVCVIDGVNPMNTLLTNSDGNIAPLLGQDPQDVGGIPFCSKMVRLNGTVSVDDMDDADVNADCGFPTATIEWATPTADDTCGEAGIICTGAFAYNVGEDHPDQSVVDALVYNGGVFLQGQWYFECTATNDCGDTVQEVWTVNVSDKHSLDAEVHVSSLIAGNVERCICFELYDEPCNDPLVTCTEMYFGPPYNFRGHATLDEPLKIAKYNWNCIAAVDPYHTLRSQGELGCVDNVWMATFKGDPLLGGNWLTSGNLDYYKDVGNSPNVIDLVDFSQFILSVQTGGVMSADTACGDPGPHGDINGDGVVDNIDYGIIEANFLASAKDVCCADGPGTFDAPVTSISVKDLRALGMGELAVADLNGDGMVDTDDMVAYQQGVSTKRTRSTR